MRARNLIVVAWALTACTFAGRAVAQGVTAYTGATVWDGTGAAPVRATIVVRGGRIVSVTSGGAPTGARVVNLAGKWVLPGFVDAHAHVTGRWAPEGTVGTKAQLEEDLRLFARYGVTTLNSLGGEPPEAGAVRSSQENPALTRARLHFAGKVIAATTPAEAAREVAANAADKVDWIKIRYDDNLGTIAKQPWPVIETVMKDAHARKMRVATHLFYLDDAKRLLRAGTDLVAHSIRDLPVDREVIDLLRTRRVCYIPTLTREVSSFTYADRPTFFDDPFFQRFADQREVRRVLAPAFQQEMRNSPAAKRYRETLRVAQRNLKTLFDAGIPIAMGTDAGPAARFPGYFEHLELQLMVEAGLTPAQALRSATGVSAQCLGVTDVGTLESGKWADFSVFDADPLTNINNTKSLRTVYIAGNEVR